MSVKLASALPKDDKNGLASIAAELIDRYHPGERTTAIVVFKTSKLTQDEEFQLTPEVKVVRIEAVHGSLEDAVLTLLQTATEQRIGKQPETLDLSDPADEFADVELQEEAPAIEGAVVTHLELESNIIDAEIVEDDDHPGGDAA